MGDDVMQHFSIYQFKLVFCIFHIQVCGRISYYL